LNTAILTAVLSKDSKDSTYKFALLRSIVECVTQRSSHHTKNEEGWDEYPFGLLIYYWLLYYYPLFAHEVFIPQKNGESPMLEKGKTIAFRREYNKIIQYYRLKGGLPQFRYDLIQDEIPEFIQRETIELIRKIQYTIKGMPMKHFGFSKFNRHYSLVKPDTSTIRTPSFSGLIKEAGSFSIRPELHSLLIDVGALIIGEDSIINGWAEFTYQAAKRNEDTEPVSKEHILSVLSRSVDIPRDISQVRNVLKSAESERLKCIWTGTRLNNNFHIDHAIPYSLWQNNNLWNLLPVKSHINLSKSDRIPAPSLIEDSAERIKEVWRLYAHSYGQQFSKEIYEGLGVQPKQGLDSAIEALMYKSSYLIEKRGFQEFVIN